MAKECVLITGANGQLGTVLTSVLVDLYGENQVISTDLRKPEEQLSRFELLDILDQSALNEVIGKNKVTQVYNLAAILSATGEKKPLLSWDVNVKGYLNVLEASRINKVAKIFSPSSIAVFGSDAPKQNCPQSVLLNPETVYGIGKSAGEQWSQYYFRKYGLDIRSIRYPGVIGYESLPGGGTTDYAVEIFHEALEKNSYTCFLKPDAYLPMIYMSDVVKATFQLMDAPSKQINTRTSYNLSGMSFSPEEIAAEIKKHLPDFAIKYEPDFRQQIADGWVYSIDDKEARADWNWKPKYNLEEMVNDMLQNLSEMKLSDVKKNEILNKI